jgi:NAD(P)H-hydrate repair Nnr-like enzyme with NAD(P)H-hydrate dehydratase domain
MVLLLPGVLVFDCDGSEEFSDGLSDPRRNAILVGPGLGLGARTRRYVEAALATGQAVVPDADALMMFNGIFEELAFRVDGPLVISPHDGEIVRLFPDLLNLGKLERVKEAAERLGVVVVLKGADTVIAEPGGNALINDNAPPWLATGGTGDVLAGTVLALGSGHAGFRGCCGCGLVKRGSGNQRRIRPARRRPSGTFRLGYRERSRGRDGPVGQGRLPYLSSEDWLI